MINPVRYPGGKGSRRIVERVLSLYPKGYFRGFRWVEPFCGGCGLGLALLERGEVSRVAFNDFDPRIHDMWRAIFFDSERLIKRIEETPVDMELFHVAKKCANDESASSFERGFYTYCLDRMCRSGYIDGGVIGGNDQSGNYKCDCRFNKNTLIKNIRKVSGLASAGKITLFPRTDAIELIGNTDLVGTGDFLYIDPPYFKKGGLCYKEQVDHTRLADILTGRVPTTSGTSLSIPWLLSYDDCPEVRSLYTNHKLNDLSITYSNNTKTRGKTKELLIESTTIF